MIDQQQFRDLMASVCSPVTVVTTMTGGTAYRPPVYGKALLGREDQITPLV